MRTPTTVSGIAVAVLAVGLALAGCGSDKKTEPTSSKSSSSSSSSSSSAPSTSAQASGPNESIADYIKKNGITETPVSRGDAGSPTLDLPIPEGWSDADAQKPPGSYGAIVYTADPAMTSPPKIVAIMSKLSDNADPAEVLNYAGGEVKNLADFEGGDGEKDKLSGFDAFQIGGTYVKDGVKLMVAQKTTVIPTPNGLYVLQINATGTEDQIGPLLDATSTIDEKTVITP